MRARRGRAQANSGNRLLSSFRWWVFVPVAIIFTIASVREAGNPLSRASGTPTGQGNVSHLILQRASDIPAPDRDFGFPVTAFSRGEKLSAWGLLDGSIKLLDEQGNLIQDLDPARMGVVTRIRCVYSLAMDSEGENLIAVYGSDPQYLLAMRRGALGYEVVASLELVARAITSMSAIFARDDSHALAVTADGLYHYDPRRGRFSRVRIPWQGRGFPEILLYGEIGSRVGGYFIGAGQTVEATFDHGVVMAWDARAATGLAVPAAADELTAGGIASSQDRNGLLSSEGAGTIAPKFNPTRAAVEFGSIRSEGESPRLTASLRLPESEIPEISDDCVYYLRLPGIAKRESAKSPIEYLACALGGETGGYRILYQYDVELIDIAVFDEIKGAWVTPAYFIAGLSDAVKPRFDVIGLLSGGGGQSAGEYLQDPARRARDRLPQGTYGLFVDATDSTQRGSYDSGLYRFKVILDGKVTGETKLDSALVTESGLSFRGADGASQPRAIRPGRYLLQETFIPRGFHVMEISIEDFAGNEARRTWSFDAF